MAVPWAEVRLLYPSGIWKKEAESAYGASLLGLPGCSSLYKLTIRPLVPTCVYALFFLIFIYLATLGLVAECGFFVAACGFF